MLEARLVVVLSNDPGDFPAVRDAQPRALVDILDDRVQCAVEVLQGQVRAFSLLNCGRHRSVCQ